MRALIAFDKFKEALTASEACAVAAGALTGLPGAWTVDECPLTDGGDGFARTLTLAAGGTLETVDVAGPRNHRVRASFGLVSGDKIPATARQRLAFPRRAGAGRVAIIEMASASGLALLAPADRDPWETTSYGTGELLLAAAARGADAIVLGVGGSATNDLGIGALAALGWRFTDGRKAEASAPVPSHWAEVRSIERGPAHSLPPIRMACDVTNPLLGPNGCVRIFAPQKGLREADVVRLEAATAAMAQRLLDRLRLAPGVMDTPGAGAAGGIAFGLMAALGARLVAGSTLVGEWLALDERIRGADLVLTGEGTFDESSLAGKSVGLVLARAAALNRRVEIFAGRIAPALRARPGVHAITPCDLPLAAALPRSGALLAAAIRRHFA